MQEPQTPRRRRTCLKCKEERDEFHFAKTNSQFFPGKRSIVCTRCLEKMVEPENWESVDRVMQWLDLPFHLDRWMQLYRKNGKHTLTEYFAMLAGEGAYAEGDKQGEEAAGRAAWKAANNEWLRVFKEGEEREKLPELKAQWRAKMQEHWSDTYTDEEFLFLEGLFNDILATQNVSTPVLRQYAENFCETSLRVKKKLRAGEDTKKDMDSLNNIVKFAEFDSKNAKNVSDFDSVGELFLYLYKLGWRPNWAQEKKDVVDVTMYNVQQYLTRLIRNEGNLAEQVEEREAAYEISRKLEENPYEEPTFQHFNEDVGSVNYEGDSELAVEISEYDDV